MAHFIEFLYSRFLLSDGVSIDTRTLQPNNLFFAISGPNFNANQFARQALDKGASYAVVDQEDFLTDDRIILAEDGLKALQELATFHRDRFRRPVVGITGSNGKTTTKELVAKVLGARYQIHYTQGNYNNHIGVPLTLLHLHPQVEIAVIEMGANHVGDIAQLCAMAKPTHGLITNIGRAHTETFGGIEGVTRGKSELFDYLKKEGGQVFVNVSDPVLAKMAKRFQSPILYPHTDFELKAANPFLQIALGTRSVQSQMVGRYNFPNMAAAVALGRFFEITDDLILDKVRDYAADNSRSELIKKGTNTLILDAYNANPDSMKVALDTLSEQAGEKLAILGDMNELENPEKDHSEVLNHAGAYGIQVLTVGKKMGRVADKASHFDSKEQLGEAIRSLKLSNTTVLLKASRSIKLETIIKCFE